MAERITHAAIWRNDDCIILGRSHAEIIKSSPPGACKNARQGFWTADNRFVDRYLAWCWALDLEQIPDPGEPYKMPKELYSEDMLATHDYFPRLGYQPKESK